MGLSLATSTADYSANDFGKSLSSFDVIKSDKQGFAEVFAEGSQELKNLLLFLWDNDIMTKGCCAGHRRGLFPSKKEPHAYVVFYLNCSYSKLRAFRNRVMNHLSETSSSYDFSVLLGDSDIGVYLHKRYPKPEIERFFSNIFEAICYSLDLQSSMTPKESFAKTQATDRKPTLADQIQAAESKKESTPAMEQGRLNPQERGK